MKLFESKKSKLFLLIFASGLLCVFTGHAKFSEYVTLIQWGFGAYVVGNGAEHKFKNEGVK